MNLIVAIDNQGGISKNNVIPWHIQEDYLFFLDTTKRNYNNKPNILIMGKNTYLSLNKPLKDRIIIVVSSTLWMNNGDYFCASLQEAVDKAIELNQGSIFFVGGKHIYENCMPYVNTIYLTQIDADYECDVTLDINADHFHTYSKDTFLLKDTKNDKEVNVSFLKLYLDECPFMRTEEHQYLDLLKKILVKGHLRQTRNAKTWSLFGETLEFDLSRFPLLSSKKVFLKAIFEELLFFLKGDTNTKHLEEKGVNIWKGNTSKEFLESVGLNYEEGDMGALYGHQLNFFNAPYQGMNYNYENIGFNQIEYCLNLLKTDPYSRRIMMTTFNPAMANQGVLYPCHGIVIQFYVEKDNKLSLICFNRSQDVFLGTNFNLSSYSLMVYMVCHILQYQGHPYTPGRLIMYLGDCHVYESHREQSIRQILRDPYLFPTLSFKRQVDKLTDFQFDDLIVNNYQCYPAIIAKMVA